MLQAILYAFIFYAFLGFLYYTTLWLIKKWKEKRARRSSTDELFRNDMGENVEQDAHSPPTTPVKVPTRERLKFLDAFRGLCIGIMVFVNYGGGLYWFFTHSSWNGLTVADLVFPWFMFIMGTSMALSFESIARNKTPRGKVFYRIVRRTVILFGLGLIVNHNFKISTLRVPGVLQRFAVSYFVVAAVRALTVTSSDSIRIKQTLRLEGVWWLRWRGVLVEVVEYWVEWVWAAVLLFIHTLISFSLPVPKCPTGYLGPGGMGDGGKYSNCTGGAAGYIDRQFFGSNHMYGHPTSKWLYNTQVPYDPEGILGSLMSILIVFFGLQAGQILIVYPNAKSRIIRFFVWALVYGLIAGILTKFSQNDGVIPVNKNLWSLSFVLSLASMANILLVVLYVVIDILHCWTGAPFHFVGMNSILIYVGHELLADFFPFSWSPANWPFSTLWDATSHGAHLLMNLWGVSLWFVIAYYLHRCKFYWSI